jgi:hypothetical protein
MMTLAINDKNNKKKNNSSTSAQLIWEHDRSKPYTWKGGVYLCFSPDTDSVIRNLQNRQALFTLSCCELMPAPTANQA